MQDTRKSPLVCRIPTSTTHVVGSCVAGVVRTLEVDVDSYEVLKKLVRSYGLSAIDHGLSASIRILTRVPES